MVYCTLFDSNYMDKGVVMINSLLRVDKDSLIYVLCMDEKCCEVLDDYYKEDLNRIMLIPLIEFMNDELAELQKQRSKAEFCWTCTARLIKYVLLRIEGDSCTYIDSDLYFYSNPTVLVEEMKLAKCTVQVVAHNFPLDDRKERRERTIGKNCVEFNTFTKNTSSLELLDKWIRQTTDDCSVENGGDQKYTDTWGDLDFVNVSANLGAGVAPWNIERFRNRQGRLRDKYEKKDYELIFYHYQNVINHERYKVTIEPLFHCVLIDKKLVLNLYLPYLKELELVKRELESQYGVLPLVKKYVAATTDNKSSSRINTFIRMTFSQKKATITNRLLRIARKRIGVVDTSKF